MLLVRRSLDLAAHASANLAFEGYSPASLPICLGIVVVAILFLMMSSHAQSEVSSPEMEFDIPTQSLDTALEAYMQATGLQVLYKSELVVSRNSSPVKGKFTSQKAIEKLLAGTDLAARSTAQGAFTISPIEVGPDRALSGQRVADYDAFLGRAQQRIIASLCGNVTTRPGSYRAALQFWIERGGLVRNPSLLDSTGDETRDRLVLEVLRGLMIGHAPPANMPQPVTMVIAPHNPNLRDECRRYQQ